MKINELLGGKRFIVGAILLVWVLFSIIYGGPWLALFIGVFIFIGVQEFVNIAKIKGINPPFYLIVLTAFIFLALASFKLYDLIFPFLSIIFITVFLVILFRGKSASINDISFTSMTIIYTGVFPLHIIFLRNLEDVSFSILGKDFSIGLGAIFLMFVVIIVCDIAAYYVGTNFGKNPLWKEISPKKTIEGSVGGTIAGVLASVLIGHFIGLNVIHSLIVGFLISVAAQLGDLTESMIKREVGIKDSGTVFPGHGGVLDRSDSYIFTGVVVYYYFKFLVIQNASAVAFISL